VVMAIGKTPNVKVNPDKVDVHFGLHAVFQEGAPALFDRAQVSHYLQSSTIHVTVALNIGKSHATVWGCDLSKGYVDINTDYS
jgi:glutamate N-acetyltransferase/amino-acid N-acetyltransferase